MEHNDLHLARLPCREAAQTMAMGNLCQGLMPAGIVLVNKKNTPVGLRPTGKCITPQ